MTYNFDDIIMNGEKSSFHKMIFDIGRLDRIVDRYISARRNLTNLSVSFDNNER